MALVSSSACTNAWGASAAEATPHAVASRIYSKIELFQTIIIVIYVNYVYDSFSGQ